MFPAQAVTALQNFEIPIEDCDGASACISLRFGNDMLLQLSFTQFDSIRTDSAIYLVSRCMLYLILTVFFLQADLKGWILNPRAYVSSLLASRAAARAAKLTEDVDNAVDTVQEEVQKKVKRLAARLDFVLPDWAQSPPSAATGHTTTADAVHAMKNVVHEEDLACVAKSLHFDDDVEHPHVTHHSNQDDADLNTAMESFLHRAFERKKKTPSPPSTMLGAGPGPRLRRAAAAARQANSSNSLEEISASWQRSAKRLPVEGPGAPSAASSSGAEPPAAAEMAPTRAELEPLPAAEAVPPAAAETAPSAAAEVEPPPPVATEAEQPAAASKPPETETAAPALEATQQDSRPVAIAEARPLRLSASDLMPHGGCGVGESTMRVTPQSISRQSSLTLGSAAPAGTSVAAAIRERRTSGAITLASTSPRTPPSPPGSTIAAASREQRSSDLLACASTLVPRMHARANDGNTGWRLVSSPPRVEARSAGAAAPAAEASPFGPAVTYRRPPPSPASGGAPPPPLNL